MRNYREYDQKVKTQKTKGIRAVKGVLAGLAICMLLGIGNTTCYAYEETPGTVIVEAAKIRPTADTTGAALASVKRNETVSICDEVTDANGTLWYQVFVNAEVKGFIRADLVKKAGAPATSTLTTTDTKPAELPPTEVTATERRDGTVVTNNVRIRKGASTNYQQIATANRGMKLTVTGEANGTDGKKWYQVSFTYNSNEVVGFIRADLVTFDALPADTAVSQITGTETETQQSNEVPQENVEIPETQQAVPESDTPAPQESNNESKDIILMNVEDTPYVLPAFELITLKWEGQDIKAYKNGDFYLFYAQKQNGEQGWFVFDSTNGTYQRYVYSAEGSTLPKENSAGNMLIYIIFIIIIAALVGLVCYMFLKLRDYTGEGLFRGSDDEEDEEEDDEEDEEEDDEEEDDDLPRRNPAPQGRERSSMNSQQRPQQPGVRRPNPNQQRPNGGQGQPQRRRVDEEGRPARPQQPGGRRPNPNQNNSGQQPRRKPNPNQGVQTNRPSKSNNAQLQNGYKAKNFLEAEEDDDMEFIDI